MVQKQCFVGEKFWLPSTNKGGKTNPPLRTDYIKRFLEPSLMPLALLATGWMDPTYRHHPLTMFGPFVSLYGKGRVPNFVCKKSGLLPNQGGRPEPNKNFQQNKFRDHIGSFWDIQNMFYTWSHRPSQKLLM